MTSKSINIEFPESVQIVVEEHCFSEVALEVGGFLVGSLTESGLNIIAAIPTLKAVSGQTNLTIGHDAWEEAHNEIAAKYAEYQIVGWFHSHPGFGVFLSEYDAFIQENFFSDARQVALVVDPIAGEIGWFNYDDSKINELSKSVTLREKIAKNDETKADVLSRLSESNNQKVSVLGSVPLWKLIAPVTLLLMLVGAVSWTLGSSSGSSRSEKQYRITVQEQLIEKKYKYELLNKFMVGDVGRNQIKGGFDLISDGGLTWDQISIMFYSSGRNADLLKLVNQIEQTENMPSPESLIWIPTDFGQIERNIEKGGFNLAADGITSWDQIIAIFYPGQVNADLLKRVNSVEKSELIPSQGIIIWIPIDLDKSISDLNTEASANPVPSVNPSASQISPTPTQSATSKASTSPTPSVSPTVKK
jgi:proteasome lid subunit RPN8/RPN11